MSSKEKKRTSILKRKSLIGGQSSDDPDSSRIGKKINFSTKKSIKEFRCEEPVKSMLAWDASYEESANCQTASDQGDTQAPNMTDMQTANFSAPIMNGPNKENIAVDMTVLGATLDNLGEGSIGSLEYSMDEQSFYQKHAYQSPCRKIAKPRHEQDLVDMSLEDNATVQRTDFTEVSFEVNGKKERRRSPRLQELENNRKTVFEASMDVTKQNTSAIVYSNIKKVQTQHKSKVPLFAASPARKKPRTTLHVPIAMDFSTTKERTVQSDNSLEMSIEDPSCSVKDKTFKKPYAPLSRTISLPKEMEMNKENISALFDHEAVNNTVCNIKQMDFEMDSVTCKKTIHKESMQMTFMGAETFAEKLDQFQFDDQNNFKTVEYSTVNMSVQNTGAAVQKSTYEAVNMNQSSFEFQVQNTKFGREKPTKKDRPTICFQNDNIQPKLFTKRSTRQSTYEVVDMNESLIEPILNNKPTPCLENENELDISPSKQHQVHKQKQRNTILFSNENSLEISKTTDKQDPPMNVNTEKLHLFPRPTIHQFKDISIERAENPDSFLQQSKLRRKTINDPKDISMDSMRSNSQIPLKPIHNTPKNISFEDKSESVPKNTPDVSMSATLRQYLELEQENMSMDVCEARVFPTKELKLGNKSPRGSVIDHNAKDKSVTKLASTRRTVLDQIDLSMEQIPVPLPRKAFQPIKDTRRTILDHRDMDSSSIGPRESICTKQGENMETEAIKPPRPKPVRRTIYDNNQMDETLIPPPLPISPKKYQRNRNTICDPDDLDITGISIDEKEHKIMKDYDAMGMQGLPTSQFLQKSDSMILDTETETVVKKLIGLETLGYNDRNKEDLPTDQAQRKSDPMEIDVDAETVVKNLNGLEKQEFDNRDNEELLAGQSLRNNESMDLDETLKTKSVKITIPDTLRRRDTSAVNEMLGRSIMNRMYEGSKRVSSARFEKTIELVKDDSLLEGVNPPSSHSLSDQDSTQLKMCSYGNLTFETLSISSRDTSKGDDSQLSQHDSCLSCSVVEESCTLTPKSRLSLSDPVLEQIRQRALKSEPIFVFCKNCQCSKDLVVPKIDEDIEKLFDFGPLLRLQGRKTETVEQIRERHKQQMLEIEMRHKSRTTTFYPETPSPRFLFENWKEQMEDVVKLAEQSFKSQYIRCPAPFPHHRDELFLIKNKIKSEHLPWTVHRSAFFHEGLFHIHHNQMKFIQVVFQIKPDYVASDLARPSVFGEIKLVPNRMHAVKTTFATMALKEFVKHFSFNQSLVYMCEDMSKLFNFLERLDQEFTQCLNIVRRLFLILIDNKMYSFIQSDAMYATRKLFLEDMKAVTQVTINLADVDHLTPLNIETIPYVNLSEKLVPTNLNGIPLLENFLSNIESLVFS